MSIIEQITALLREQYGRRLLGSGSPTRKGHKWKLVGNYEMEVDKFIMDQNYPTVERVSAIWDDDCNDTTIFMYYTIYPTNHKLGT